MVHSVQTSPILIIIGIEQGKRLLGKFKIRDLNSHKVKEDDLPASFGMTYTTILDLVRAKKNTMITTLETNPENLSKRVTATSANIPPSKRTKSDHDGSTSSPAQSLTIP